MIQIVCALVLIIGTPTVGVAETVDELLLDETASDKKDTGARDLPSTPIREDVTRSDVRGARGRLSAQEAFIEREKEMNFGRKKMSRHGRSAMSRERILRPEEETAVR